jgi:MFS family permease
MVPAWKPFGLGLRSSSVLLVCFLSSYFPLHHFVINTHKVFQPTFASLSNIFGRKSLTLAGLAFFLAGTIVAGVSQDFTVLIAGRCVQGVGGGGLIALSEIILTDLVPLRLRGLYFAYLGSAWSVGSVIGPILGGGFAQNISWVSFPRLT